MPAPVETSRATLPHILIVEDDEAARAMLAAWVHTEGYRFQVARSAAAGDAFLSEHEFDLILCDVNLPDRDGPEFIADISGANQGVPVIFLTGSPSIDTAIRSVRLRVAAYLVKPPDLDELSLLVRREVATYRNRRILAASREHLHQWDDELAHLEQSADAPNAQPLVNYLQITLRHFATVLGELDQSVSTLAANDAGRAALAQIDLIASLRRTVQVLEKSREHFKSKELGELRRELASILGHLDGDAGRKTKLKG
jgi:DNA-binding response OmpR family regulator